MTAKRNANFLIGKVVIDGASSTAAPVTVSSGSIAVTALPAASPFTDASTNIGTGAGVVLATHAVKYEFAVTNTHATQILYIGDTNVSTTRYIRAVYPGQTERFQCAGNTNTFYVTASGATTGMVLGGY